MSTILQLNPPIEMWNKEFGDVWALFIIDYGPDVNCVFLCKINSSGALKHFSTEQLAASRNYTFQKKI